MPSGKLINQLQMRSLGNKNKKKFTDKSSAFGLLIAEWSVSRPVVVGIVIITGVVLGCNVSRRNRSGRRDGLGVVFRLERVLTHQVFVIERILVVRRFILFQLALVVILQYPPRN